jgi:hypothetical protein
LGGQCGFGGTQFQTINIDAVLWSAVYEAGEQVVMQVSTPALKLNILPCFCSVSSCLSIT